MTDREKLYGLYFLRAGWGIVGLVLARDLGLAGRALYDYLESGERDGAVAGYVAIAYLLALESWAVYRMYRAHKKINEIKKSQQNKNER